MLSNEPDFLVSSIFSDECEEKPCYAAKTCDLDLKNECVCNGPMRFDPDFNCVGEFTILCSSHKQNFTYDI